MMAYNAHYQGFQQDYGDYGSYQQHGGPQYGKHGAPAYFAQPTHYASPPGNHNYGQDIPMEPLKRSHPYAKQQTSLGVASHGYEPIREDASVHSRKTWRQSNMSGWRFSASLFAAAAAAVLVANIAISIYSVGQYGGKLTAEFKPVFVGDCEKTKTINTWAHLAINVLSSLLLSGSNYCMQVLTAPSRNAVDEAHAKRRWLDIGVPSFRNLGSMSHKRRTLWALILITSAPLHLVYNSIFSQSWTRQAYEAALVTEDFLDGANFYFSYAGSDRQKLFTEIQQNLTTYQRLEPMECLKAYNKPAILDRKTVLVVTSSRRPPLNGSGLNITLNDGSVNPIYAKEDFVGNEVNLNGGLWDWMCDTYHNYSVVCNLEDVISGQKQWSPFFPGIKVDYCLSEYLGEKCTLDFSFGLMAVVCVCNLIKLVCMVVLCFSMGPPPLLNVGDAISSFLNSPDSTTMGMCLASKTDVDLKYWKKKGYGAPVDPISWNASRVRWFRAVSRKRWLAFGILASASIVTAVVLLSIGLSNSRSEGLNMSFGVASINSGNPNIITYSHEAYQPHRLVINILLANLAQLIISFLFLAYNSILTAMLMAKEWSEFAKNRKYLRVTSPVGNQKATYWLSLPYRYAVSLLLSSMLLHWLTSQAIFLDRRIVEQVWWNEPYTDNDVGSVSTVGYSPFAVILCLLLGVLMLFALFAIGFRRYKPGMPLAASCSAAISAACHLPAGEKDSSTLPLQWGVRAGESWDAVGHCSFSSREVTMPLPDRRYAG